MLVLESYKPFETDFQEVAMAPTYDDFGRKRDPAHDRDDFWRTRTPHKTAPADQLMYAWSIKVTEEKYEKTPMPRRDESCPPEVYLG